MEGGQWSAKNMESDARKEAKAKAPKEELNDYRDNREQPSKTLTEKSNSFGMYANAHIRGEAARRSPRRELSARPPPQHHERVTQEGTSMMHMLAKSFKPQEKFPLA